MSSEDFIKLYEKTQKDNYIQESYWRGEALAQIAIALTQIKELMERAK